MKCGEFRHDLYVIPFLTDYVAMAPKYHGNIPVEGNRRDVGIVRKTCEAVNTGLRDYICGTMNRYVRATNLSMGFSGWTVSS